MILFASQFLSKAALACTQISFSACLDKELQSYYDQLWNVEFLKLPITFFLSVQNFTIIVCLSTLPVESQSKREVLTSRPSYQDLLTPIMGNKIQCRILKHTVNVRLRHNLNLSLFQTPVCIRFVLQVLDITGMRRHVGI